MEKDLKIESIKEYIEEIEKLVLNINSLTIYSLRKLKTKDLEKLKELRNLMTDVIRITQASKKLNDSFKSLNNKLEK